MFSSFQLDHAGREDCGGDLTLEFDDGDVQTEYEDFYEDVYPEMRNIGRIRRFVVCSNHAPHLRGNVYIDYERKKDAERAYEACYGRWFDRRQLSCGFVIIPNWTQAICGLHLMNKCHKAAKCNYLHPFRRPRHFPGQPEPYSQRTPPFRNSRPSNISKASSRTRQKIREVSTFRIQNQNVDYQKRKSRISPICNRREKRQRDRDGCIDKISTESESVSKYNSTCKKKLQSLVGSSRSRNRSKNRSRTRSKSITRNRSKSKSRTRSRNRSKSRSRNKSVKRSKKNHQKGRREGKEERRDDVEEEVGSRVGDDGGVGGVSKGTGSGKKSKKSKHSRNHESKKDKKS